MKSFSAQIDDFIAKCERRTVAVFRESTERVKDEMQKPVGAGGNMPIKTGFLRSSLMASTSSMPMMSRSNPGGAVPTGDDVSLIIAGADLGDTIFMGYVANYAGHVNYGANGRAPRRFVDLAAQQWPAIVAGVAAEVRGKG